MIADFTIAPVGVGESLSPYVAEVFRIIHNSGIAYEHHAMGTNLEGDWDDVMAVVKACRARLLESAHRVSISLKIDDRVGVTDGLTRKLSSVHEKL